MGTIYPWRHERKLRLRDEKTDFLGEVNAPWKRRKLGYCKKLKGTHRYLFTKKIAFIVLDGGLEIWNCVGCGKKKLKSIR